MRNMVWPIDEYFFTLRTFQIVLRDDLTEIWRMVTVRMDSVGSRDLEPQSASCAAGVLTFRISIMSSSLVSIQVEL